MVSYVKGIKRMFTDAFHKTILKFNSVYAIRLFYPIGTGDNRGAMSLGEFAAKKIGTEEVSMDGKAYSCIKSVWCSPCSLGLGRGFSGSILQPDR